MVQPPYQALIPGFTGDPEAHRHRIPEVVDDGRKEKAYQPFCRAGKEEERDEDDAEIDISIRK